EVTKGKIVHYSRERSTSKPQLKELKTEFMLIYKNFQEQENSSEEHKGVKKDKNRVLTEHQDHNVNLKNRRQKPEVYKDTNCKLCDESELETLEHLAACKNLRIFYGVEASNNEKIFIRTYLAKELILESTYRKLQLARIKSKKCTKIANWKRRVGIIRAIKRSNLLVKERKKKPTKIEHLIQEVIVIEVRKVKKKEDQFVLDKHSKE
ncbi:22083_t:CDS:2, partial [Gigaspora margarita]